MHTRILIADETAVAEAATLLRGGACVAFPTETVYGLGADATSDVAVAAIYAAKDRPRFNPLIGHVASLEAAQREGLLNDAALALGQAFWPGPLTLVVPRAQRGSIGALARAGLDSVGLRVPSHPVAQALLRAVGRPLAAPSANRSGRVSPTSAAHVASDLSGRIPLILDGGAAQVGVESTILACLDGTVRLLRPGGIPRGAIEAVLGHSLQIGIADSGAPIAPGLLASHYAPRALLRLNARTVAPDEAVLDFGGALRNAAEGPYIDLSPSGDDGQAAAALFEALRRLDASGAMTIAVAPIPQTGLGEAICDRLARAAAPRP